MTMTNNFSPPAESAAASAIPVRLLSSVAVVGRDNEPIYLRGDLCECCNTVTSAATPQESTGASSTVIAEDEDSNNEETCDATNSTGEDERSGVDDDSSPGSNGNRGGKKGLFGRFKGKVGRNNGNANADNENSADENQEQHRHDSEGTANNEDDENDPFGFFENSNSTQSNDDSTIGGGTVPANIMSLTQQLVLHASLDRFEEIMASRSNRGGGAVRWRTPGSNSANAMWLGLLCEVEERWNVYGYLTNTGIKFMILVENVYLNPDGSRCSRQDHAPPILFANNLLPTSSSLLNGNSSREADLKNILAQLHELYVRHTMNPFSRLRGPIQSRIFDKGIVQMAQSFNSAALQQISSSFGGRGFNNSNGLVWM
ncbi:hypothetical protein ACHAXR_008280 [Thalassiosira sp. AJA248-18]